MAEAITEDVILRLLKGPDGKIEKIPFPKITKDTTLTKEQIKDLLYAEFIASACQACATERPLMEKKICSDFPKTGPIEALSVCVSVCIFPPKEDGGNPRTFSAFCDPIGTPWP